ncbi:MAG: acyl-CoA thioesterase/BAAT N-terminal domain-containing protein [Candidatus Dormibacteraeota bacterium]|nr:acyl-CoA thioesterase/BAAT N-terminal domain-containing protein [Candidatus Dormibacteraeota bacterium]
MSGRWQRAIGSLAVLGLLALPACQSKPAAALSLQVDRATALIDQPLQITVSGVDAGAQATVALSTVDRLGARWSSSARFTADSAGQIRVAAQAPTSGDYSGVQPMGLFSSLHADSSSALAFYLPPAPTQTAILTVTAGSASADRSVIRELTHTGLTVIDTRPEQEGFYGEYYSQRGMTSFLPSVIVLGGSEGGLYFSALTARMLAAHGYPSLAVAYFQAPGLPSTLSNIPLEYFTRALAWIRQQPGVDSSHVLVYGISRGSEAALLLGANFPEQVNGVIALAPTDAATSAAWTLAGKPIPFTSQLNEPHPTDSPAALIPVANVKGPVFMACGGADRVWSSCPYARAIGAELDAAHKGYPYTLLSYPQAGHGVGNLVPYTLAGRMGTLDGASLLANDLARAKAWPRLLDFLSALRSP